MIEPARTDLVQRDTIRLISTARLKEPVLLALSPNHGAMEDLAELEGATSGRLQAQEGSLLDLDPKELVFGRPGHTFINAAFTYTRPGGNRFNDDERGAWYCAFLAETALAEVSFHLSRELEAINRFENITDYAELIADFVGQFHDLRGKAFATDPCLSTDPGVAYPAGQSMAKWLRMEKDSLGLIYPSARSAGGHCLVAFHPSLVQNLRQGGTWRLEWQGSPEPEISKL
ncbi:RES domain-containing protein [Sinorhizobium medicae]|nr:RES domain-containing protein [Sinorhizobium medicae]MQV46314.1 RES domain-containing protein [Sinorhizobium medicae]MQV54045.1 RES domain-containing protein [Sinorhizobium medicae]MQV71684.1 RES domain-containing protein [Sinorhizobium medicae]